MSISHFIWTEMQKHFDRVKQGKLDGKSLQLQLNGAKHLTLEKFHANGIWYTGVHDLSPSGTIIPMSGMNFDEDEWDKLMEHVEEINSSVVLLERPESFGTKCNFSGQSLNREVLMYKWKWISGKKKLSESEIGFFTEEHCKQDAQLNSPGTDKASVIIEKVWGPPPKKYVHMKEVLMYLLSGYIEVLKKEKCEGCKIDSPTQKDHMSTSGCLSEDVNFAELYCEEALEKITESDMILLFEKSCRLMGKNCSDGQIHAEICMYYCDQKKSIQYLNSTCKLNRNISMLLQTC